MYCEKIRKITIIALEFIENSIYLFYCIVKERITNIPKPRV